MLKPYQMKVVASHAMLFLCIGCGDGTGGGPTGPTGCQVTVGGEQMWCIAVAYEPTTTTGTEVGAGAAIFLASQATPGKSYVFASATPSKEISWNPDPHAYRAFALTRSCFC